MNEKNLFKGISEGSEIAFDQLYTILLSDFGAYILKMVKSEDALKEVLQEAFIRLWLNRDKLPEIDVPRAWFFRIIANECYRYMSKNAVQHLQTHIIEERGDTETEKQLAFKEMQHLIQDALHELSPRQLAVYKMSREEGLTLPEVALKLDLSRDYVKKVLMTALAKIRKVLIASGYLCPLYIFFKIFF